jgi:PPOX class probable F420-dependent enzyme
LSAWQSTAKGQVGSEKLQGHDVTAAHSHPFFLQFHPMDETAVTFCRKQRAGFLATIHICAKQAAREKRKEPIFHMSTILSERAQAFLQEEGRFAILATIGKDGSPQLTTMWYLIEEDGTIIMNTQVHLQKTKNIRRDPRIALSIEDGGRYVSLNGNVEVIEDQATIQDELVRLIERYVQGEETRKQYRELFFSQPRISLHLKSKKVNEFFS